MVYERQTHWQFLNDELRAETEEFKKKFEAKASFLLNDSEEMFVGQFISFKNGEMIMRFPNSRSIPRKGDFLYCMLLPKELRDFHQWGDLTYEKLYQNRYKGTECAVIWHSPSDDPRLTLVGLRRVDVDFQSMVEDSPGVFLVFAPQMPPTEYIANLQQVVQDSGNEQISRVLDIDYQPSEWEPSLIKEMNPAGFVLRQLELTNTMILQGPPGTGKTTLIAKVCSQLIKDGKSVLITALTNRALMEIAGKEDLAEALETGQICKTNVSSDEIQELRSLNPVKQLSPMPGTIMLSTFFISSGFAAESCGTPPFDYVIMDEASQAITPMFAAVAKIGKKCLWVGDTNQLPPIVSLNDDIISERQYRPLVNGLNLMASSGVPVYQLTKTYRFGQRAARYTGTFYNGSLISNTDRNVPVEPSLRNILHPQGGPSLVLTDMPLGNSAPDYAIKMATYIVSRFLREDKSKEIAVLTCLIKTTKALQKCIAQNIGSGPNLIVDTVARVQGLTTDIVIYVVPNISYLRTIEPHLFNVATSRAREHTIIIADKEILSYPNMDVGVRSYLQSLYGEKMVYVPYSDGAIKMLD